MTYQLCFPCKDPAQTCFMAHKNALLWTIKFTDLVKQNKNCIFSFSLIEKLSEYSFFFFFKHLTAGHKPPPTPPKSPIPEHRTLVSVAFWTVIGFQTSSDAMKSSRLCRSWESLLEPPVSQWHATATLTCFHFKTHIFSDVHAQHPHHTGVFRTPKTETFETLLTPF